MLHKRCYRGYPYRYVRLPLANTQPKGKCIIVDDNPVTEWTNPPASASEWYAYIGEANYISG